MNNDLKKIGARFKYFRTDILKISQMDLAKKLNTTQKTLSLYESGDRIPHSKIMIKMLDLFNLNKDWLFEERGNPQLNNEDIQITNESTLVRINVLEKRIERMETLVNTLIEKIVKSS